MSASLASFSTLGTAHFVSYLHKMTIAQQTELSTLTKSNSYDTQPSAKPSLNHVIQATPYIDIVVPHSNLFEGATEVILALFPQWTKEELDFLQCKDGITNKCEYT